MHDTQLLQYVYKTADMGCEGIQSVLDYTQSTAQVHLLGFPLILWLLEKWLSNTQIQKLQKWLFKVTKWE